MVLSQGDFINLDTDLLDTIEVLITFEDRIGDDRHVDTVIKSVSGDQNTILKNEWNVLSQRFVLSMTLYNPSDTDTVPVSLRLVKNPKSWDIGSYELEPRAYQHVPVTQLASSRL